MHQNTGNQIYQIIFDYYLALGTPGPPSITAHHQHFLAPAATETDPILVVGHVLNIVFTTLFYKYICVCVGV